MIVQNEERTCKGELFPRGFLDQRGGTAIAKDVLSECRIEMQRHSHCGSERLGRRLSLEMLPEKTGEVVYGREVFRSNVGVRKEAF